MDVEDDIVTPGPLRVQFSVFSAQGMHLALAAGTEQWTMLMSVCVPPSRGLVHVRYEVGRLSYGCWDVRGALAVKLKDRDEECHAHDEEEHCRRRRR
jgi:hypothetical protein